MEQRGGILADMLDRTTSPRMAWWWREKKMTPTNNWMFSPEDSPGSAVPVITAPAVVRNLRRVWHRKSSSNEAVQDQRLHCDSGWKRRQRSSESSRRPGNCGSPMTTNRMGL